MAPKKDLSVEFLGTRCENPFFLSSSPVGADYDMIAKGFRLGWGGVVSKTIGIVVSDECSPRFATTRQEGMSWLGLKNLDQISEKPTEYNFEQLAKLKRDFPEKIVVASIMGSSEKEWSQLAKMAEQAGVDFIEGNLSCPQMTVDGCGCDVGSNPEMVRRYTRVITSATKLPFIAKMTPNITDITLPAKAALEGGAAAISAINSIRCITNIDLEYNTALPVVAGKSAISGYSGAAIRPIALRFIQQLRNDPAIGKIPISGIGGIETWHDCVEFLLLGCRNLQVTTAVMQYGYRIVEDMIDGLKYYMQERGFDKLDDFIGLAHSNILSPDKLDRDYYLFPAFDPDKCIGCGRCYISCYDGGHQAISWDEDARRPVFHAERCVGCHLCMNVCPLNDVISPGEVRFKEGRSKHPVPCQHDYD
jgi:dihydropyrimidine dehydrogenase (NAD+) subunit PreA